MIIITPCIYGYRGKRDTRITEIFNTISVARYKKFEIKENDQLTTTIDIIKEQDVIRKVINCNVIAEINSKENDQSNQPIGNTQGKCNIAENITQIT